MSSRVHNCPKCSDTWVCNGCHTQNIERLCDTCMDSLQTKPVTLDYLIREFRGHNFKHVEDPGLIGSGGMSEMYCDLVVEALEELKRLKEEK